MANRLAVGATAALGAIAVPTATVSSVPPPETICTMIYGTYERAIGLGDDLVPGQQYRVDVNGTAVTFTA